MGTSLYSALRRTPTLVNRQQAIESALQGQDLGEIVKRSRFALGKDHRVVLEKSIPYDESIISLPIVVGQQYFIDDGPDNIDKVYVITFIESNNRTILVVVDKTNAIYLCDKVELIMELSEMCRNHDGSLFDPNSV
jgi:hypothetical protein